MQGPGRLTTGVFHGIHHRAHHGIHHGNFFFTKVLQARGAQGVGVFSGRRRTRTRPATATAASCCGCPGRPSRRRGPGGSPSPRQRTMRRRRTRKLQRTPARTSTHNTLSPLTRPRPLPAAQSSPRSLLSDPRSIHARRPPAACDAFGVFGAILRGKLGWKAPIFSWRERS